MSDLVKNAGCVLLLLIASCLDSAADPDNADTSDTTEVICHRENATGQYDVEYASEGYSCIDLFDGTVTLIGGIGDISFSPDCEIDYYKTSANECTIEFKTTCTEGYSSTQVISIVVEQLDEGLVLSGVETVTLYDWVGRLICFSSYNLTYIKKSSGSY